MEDIEKIRDITMAFMDKIQKERINLKELEKMKNFIDGQFAIEKNKSKLNCDKNALRKLINGQIW